MESSRFRLLVIFILVSLFAQCWGQGKVCKKTLKGKQGDIFIPKKPPCILKNITANIVTVGVGGNLTVDGVSVIKTIVALDGAIITLKNKTEVTTVSVTDKASIEILVEEKSIVRALVLSRAGKTQAQGNFGTIRSVNSGTLKVFSSNVRRDIRVQGGGGKVDIRSTALKKGGIFVKSRKGLVKLQSSSFGVSSFSELSGDLNITTSAANKRCTVENVKGQVSLSGTGFLGPVVVSESKSRKVGLTTIKESSFRGGKVRLTVSRRGKLSVTSANFFKGIASFKRIGGPVLFMRNGDVRASFVRNRRLQFFENNIKRANLNSCTGGIEMQRNSFGTAVITKCRGAIKIRQNLFRILQCTGNNPAPGGKENSIKKKATGQCAKFQR